MLDNKRPQILDEGGNYIGRDNIPWSENEKEEIQSLVRNAIGFNEARGDRVSVVNMPFGKAVEEDKAAELEATRVRNQFILDLIRYVALGAAVLALIMLVIRPMVQRLSTKPADLDLLMSLPATIGELEGEELEIPTERESGLPPREKFSKWPREIRSRPQASYVLGCATRSNQSRQSWWLSWHPCRSLYFPLALLSYELTRGP